MGYYMSCGEIVYSSTYMYWNTVRHHIMFCFFEYLNSIVSTNDQTNIMLNFINEMDSMKKNDVLLSFLNVYDNYSVFFENLNLDGIFIFLNKSDCDGYYSVSDCKKIFDLLTIIYSTINSRYKSDVDTIMKIYKISVITDTSVVIS